MTIQLLIFFSISALSGILRIYSFKKIRNRCEKTVYIIPKRTYFWHIAGPAIIFILLLCFILADFPAKIEPSVPSGIFAVFSGICGGACIVIMSIYCFTNAGIYENGILTHFIFVTCDQIKGYELSDQSSLHIDSQMKTCKLQLKDQTYRAPSFEYLKKDEKNLKSAMSSCHIAEL